MVAFNCSILGGQNKVDKLLIKFVFGYEYAYIYHVLIDGSFLIAA